MQTSPTTWQLGCYNTPIAFSGHLAPEAGAFGPGAYGP